MWKSHVCKTSDPGGAPRLCPEGGRGKEIKENDVDQDSRTAICGALHPSNSLLQGRFVARFRDLRFPLGPMVPWVGHRPMIGNGGQTLLSDDPTRIHPGRPEGIVMRLRSRILGGVARIELGTIVRATKSIRAHLPYLPSFHHLRFCGVRILAAHPRGFAVKEPKVLMLRTPMWA